MAYNSLQDIFITMIGFVTWPPLKDDGTKRYTRMPCKLLYVIRVKETFNNFLALLDIRVFGRLLCIAASD